MGARLAACLRLVMLSIALPAFAGGATTPTEYRTTLYLFGTLMEITLVGVPAERAEQVTDRLEREFQRMHRDWHAWKLGELSALNARLPSGEWIPISPFVAPLIAHSRPLSRLSNGLFNPAIGALVELWGFHSDELPVGKAPPADAIRRLVAAAPGMDDLELADGRVRAGNPAVQLDFGAFAKGYALDLARETLASLGVGNALLNSGGDLCALGSAADGPWRIGIRHPFQDSLLATLEIDAAECVMTSGNYERYREDQGVRWGHIIDPRTGYPAAEVASSTVVHAQGGLADAAATALAVAGPSEWLNIAARLAVDQVMLVDAAGTVRVSERLAPRLTFPAGSQPPVLVALPPSDTPPQP